MIDSGNGSPDWHPNHDVHPQVLLQWRHLSPEVRRTHRPPRNLRFARVVMNKWDTMWLERMPENKIRVITGVRYVDNIRAFLHTIRAGWRMWEGRLCFSEEWKDLDLKDGKSSTRRTAETLS